MALNPQFTACRRLVAACLTADRTFESRSCDSSIPVLIFTVAGVSEAAGGRVVHHGSGSSSEFRAVLEQLHASCGPLPTSEAS